METTADRTVREIAVEAPASIRVFESLGIDYCCGGKRSLTDACARANVEVDRVLALIEAVSCEARVEPAAAWNHRPLREVIVHIVETHHAYVRAEIPRLQALSAKVAGKHGPTHAELPQIEDLFAALSQELLAHLMKEERILFPYIAALERSTLTSEALPESCFGAVARPIANMVAEHDDAGAILAQIRELSHHFQAPPEACPSFLGLYQGLADFERDLHQHIHLENNLLFPRAIAMEQAHA